MKKIELEQGSLDWHLYRGKHRNASEAGAVMGANPYQTRYQLWQARSGESEFHGNAATRHGNEMEPIALAKASEVLGIPFEPAVFEDGDYSASLDGYFAGNGGSYKVEIKCPYTGLDSVLWKMITTPSDDLSERIPEMYRWQLAHQCMVVPTDKTVFFVYIDDDTWDFVDFYPSSYDNINLMLAWNDFIDNPPEPDKALITDENTIERIAAHKMLVDVKKEIEAQIKEVEADIKELVTVSSECDIASIAWVERQGSVQYKRVPELENVDLEQYRAKSSRYMKITHRKQA